METQLIIGKKLLLKELEDIAFTCLKEGQTLTEAERSSDEFMRIASANFARLYLENLIKLQMDA